MAATAVVGAGYSTLALTALPDRTRIRRTAPAGLHQIAQQMTGVGRVLGSLYAFPQRSVLHKENPLPRLIQSAERRRDAPIVFLSTQGISEQPLGYCEGEFLRSPTLLAVVSHCTCQEADIALHGTATG